MSLLENSQKKATAVNAREMIIFSYPKVGKTELVTKLPGKYLILDFEGGTDYFNCNAISLNENSAEKNLEKFNQLRDEFTETNPQYDFIVFDTLTSLYDNIVNSIAINMYNKEEKKAKTLDFDLGTLAYGVGYTYKRQAMQKVIQFFKGYCKCLIMMGHVADKAMGDTAAQLNIKDLAIEGKLKDILALKTDAMGLLFRAEKNINKLSFSPATGLIGGTRIPHLSNKEIIISKKLDDGTLETYWKEVFI